MSNDLGDTMIIARRELNKLLAGYRLSQALYVAVKLDIPDLLGDRAVAVEELARLNLADRDCLLRFLRVLAGIGIVSEGPQGTFMLTAMGALLRREAPESLFPRASAIGEEWNWRTWGQLLESVTRGRPAFQVLFGKTTFDYFSEHANAGCTLHARMAIEGKRRGRAIACAFEFDQWRVIADLGGGQGAVLAEILAQHPSTRGVLMDAASALVGWENILGQRGVIERCQVVAGDFFRHVPEEADVYILSAILHSWSDREVVDILSNVRRVMDGRRTRLLIVDELIEECKEPNVELLLKDLQLLVNTTGRQRTEAELRRLIGESGLRFHSKSLVGSGEWLIEACNTS